MVQIKPYYNYYRWMDWIDLSGLDQSAAVDALEDTVISLSLAFLDLSDTVTSLALDIGAAIAAADNAQIAADNAQATANTALANAASAENVYSDYHFLLPRQMLPLSGAGFGAFTVAATSPLNGACLMTGNGGEVFIGLAMDAGNWRIAVNCIALVTGVNVIIQNNGVTILSFETYNATQLNNQEFTGDFVVAGAGRQQITLLISGRPAGNTTGYNLWCSYLMFYRR